MNFLGEVKMKTREDKRMVKLEFLKTATFENILIKSSHSFFGA
jgi:hypothetical protein